MKKSTLVAAGVFTASLLVSSSVDAALAQGRGRGPDKIQGSGAVKDKDKDKKKDKDKDKDRDRDRDRDREVARDKADTSKAAKTRGDHEPRFDGRDREIITRYYERRSGLPPGLAKRNGNLPPGLEKQLQRNGTLPPGLQKKLTPLPVALERQLLGLPRGFRRGIIDRHLVVYRDGTYVIADTIFDAVR